MDILVIITPCLIGALIIVCLFPHDSLRKANLILTVFLGTGLGLGITSAAIFLWLVIFGQPNSYYFIAESGLVLLLFIMASYRISSPKHPQGDSIIRSNSDFNAVAWLKYLFFILLVFSLASFILKAAAHDPHGKYDAWAIWNLRARMLFHGGTQWSSAFSKEFIFSHPDYPLLLPGSVFRMWVIISTDSIAVPITIAGFFTFGSVLLILQCLAIIRGQNQGYLAAFCMLIATQFLKIGAYQYADIPLAFFILAAILLLTLKEKYPSAALRFMFLAGLATSCAAWTKNEGLLFLVLMIIVLILSHIVNKQRRWTKELVCFLFGLAPILGIEFFFKIKFAPPNDIFNLDNVSNIFFYLIQMDRYQQIFLKFVKKVFLFNDGIIFLMLIYVYFCGLDKEFFNKRIFFPLVTLLGLLFGGYFFSYLISPIDLKWHLNSSLYRLVMHVWPSFVFLFFLCTKGADKSTMNEERA